MANNPILELVQRLQWDKNDDPKQYTFYYYDAFARQKFGFSFSDIKLVDGVNLVLRKDDGTVSIPTHRVIEVKKGGTYVIKRDLKEL